MKKKLFLLLSILITSFIGYSQNNDEITILYLLPFHLNEGDIASSSLRSSADIHQMRQFEMMGFWLSAKMALKEYENTDKTINVIVRDATTDKNALKKILEDSVLMAPVDIIIGPFYGTLFPTASEYAKNHNLTIINPFSTRYDFVEANPAVYKLTPPFISRPETVVERFLKTPEQYNVILWGDSTTTIEMQAYKYYFDEHNIRYKEVHTLAIPQDMSKTNLIIAIFEQQERVIHAVHTLVNQEDEIEYDRIVVVPEKWLSISELTEDFYNISELFFFSNCFVDENNDRVKLYQFDYLYNNEAPADLADYAYQGYDITRYFIDLFFAEFDHNEVQFEPLSYKFSWKQIEGGGFENVKTRLIQVKDLELHEASDF